MEVFLANYEWNVHVEKKEDVTAIVIDGRKLINRLMTSMLAVLFCFVFTGSASAWVGITPVRDDPQFAGNMHNASLALEYLSGTVTNPGEEFSFNEVVGPRTEDRGFVQGLSVSGGRFIPDIGGGVCQTATTLNLAVDHAGLTVTERHRHSIPVPYAPGKDAAVWYGKQDYRFINTLSVPVAIYGFVDERGVAVELIPLLSGITAFFPGCRMALINGTPVDMGRWAYIYEGTTFIPEKGTQLLLSLSKTKVPVSRAAAGYTQLRRTAESLGLNVSWNEEFSAVVVNNHSAGVKQ